VTAAAQGAKTIVADPSVDVWALGVIAYELLTHQAAFDPALVTEKQVWELLCSQRLLPWEKAMGRGQLGKMRALKDGVLACLSRDPRLRPSASGLLQSWSALFDSRS
jgi:serine/threonine protein kinase